MAEGYAFGDTDIATARLRVLADVFAAPSKALLSRLAPWLAPPVVLDLGCGPGHTTALLHRCFPDAAVVGLDVSEAFVAHARRTYPEARFEVADVTALPLPHAPADVVYDRFVLAYLPDPCGLLEQWLTQVVAGGFLVVDELEFIHADDALLARYVQLAEAIVRHGGSDMYAGPLLGRCAPARSVVLNEVREHPVTAGDAARMFTLNLQVWGDEAVEASLVDGAEVSALADRLAARLAAHDVPPVRWGLRQLILEQDAG